MTTAINSFLFQDKYKVDVDIHRPTTLTLKDKGRLADPLSDTLPSMADLKTTLVFLNALGVPRYKYAQFFAALTAKGYTVIAADYPCCGDNKPILNRSINYDYQDLVADFIPQLLHFAIDTDTNTDTDTVTHTNVIDIKTKPQQKSQRVLLMGHSLGGQLATLYSALYGTPMIGIATGNLHYKNWQGLGQLNIFRAALVFKMLTNIYGYLPGYKIGIGDREAKGLINDWCHMAMTGRYDFIDKGVNTSKGNGLYLCMTGDNYAPYQSTKHLAKLCEQAKLVEVTLPKGVKGNPHGVWIKNMAVIEDIISHIDEHLSAISSN